MFKFITKSVALIDDLYHDDWIGDEKLLNQRGCLYFGVCHEKHDHDFDLVYEWEKVKQPSYVVQYWVKNPVCRPVRELSIISLFSPEFGQMEERLVRWVQKIAKYVHCYQQ